MFFFMQAFFLAIVSATYAEIGMITTKNSKALMITPIKEFHR